MTRRKSPSDLRSARWFAPDDMRSMGHRSRWMQMGYAAEDWVGKPMIAILNTWSDAQPCHAHFKDRVEDVKRGILQAGGFPIELPALSLSESIVKPTTMLYRNLLAMEAEELMRGRIPSTASVLMGGCDKTTPALLMGATSARPADDLRAGRTDAARQLEGARCSALARTPGSTGTSAAPATSPTGTGSDVEAGIARSYGVCMTMGTASTMTAIAEAHRHDAAGSFRRFRRRTPTTSACASDRRPAHRRHGLGGPDAHRRS